MNGIREIEQALKQLPLGGQLEVARWLLKYLQGKSTMDSLVPCAAISDESPILQPDYSARRRRIFGSKILPNMGLVDRGRKAVDGLPEE